MPDKPDVDTWKIKWRQLFLLRRKVEIEDVSDMGKFCQASDMLARVLKSLTKS